MSSFEVLLTCEASGQLWNCCVWDPGSGAALHTYKGHATKSRSLCFLGDTLMVSCRPGKPVLNVWNPQRHEQVAKVITTPGPASVLASTASGKFLVGGIEEKLYVWQTCNGKLHRVLSAHFQPVTCVRFTDDSSHFVSAGKDGSVNVWDLGEVVSARPARPAQPRWHWAHHRLDVADMHVTGGSGLRARLFTASADHTSKAYCLASGSQLLDVSFSQPLTAVTADTAEVNVFLGAENGSIFTYSLHAAPRDLQSTLGADPARTMLGHSKAVTCLSVSADATVLASGSDDRTVRLWSVVARQCLRSIEHKAEITAVALRPPLKRESKLKAADIVLANLEKTLSDSPNESSSLKLEIATPRRPVRPPAVEASFRWAAASGPQARGKRSLDADPPEDAEQADVPLLKRANRELYEFAVKHVINSK